MRSARAAAPTRLQPNMVACGPPQAIRQFDTWCQASTSSRTCTTYEELFNGDPVLSAMRDSVSVCAKSWTPPADALCGAPSNVRFGAEPPEPNGQLKDSNLMVVLTNALAACKVSNRTRPVVIGGQELVGDRIKLAIQHARAIL